MNSGAQSALPGSVDEILLSFKFPEMCKEVKDSSWCSLCDRYSSYSSWSRLSGMRREVYQPECLHELVDVDAPVLVEVNALGQVCDGLVTDLHLKMRAQELPGLTKLLERDQTWTATWRRRP